MARTPGAEKILIAAAREEASELAAGAAIRALGTLRSPRAFETLTRALTRESHADRVRVAALDGLGSLGDSRAVPVALEHAPGGRPSNVRVAAIGALRDLGRGQRVVASRLVALLEDPDPRVRRAAAGALGSLGEARTRGRLRESLGIEPIASVRREMAKAIEKIESVEGPR
jgi:HEAT repeat protein